MYNFCQMYNNFIIIVSECQLSIKLQIFCSLHQNIRQKEEPKDRKRYKQNEYKEKKSRKTDHRHDKQGKKNRQKIKIKERYKL